MPVNPSQAHDTLITAEGARLLHYLRSLPSYRQLLMFLVWKDLKVQVAHTVLGFGWLVLRPLLNALVLTLVFGRLARLPSEGHPYLLFLLSGFLPWSYFSGIAGKSANSLIGNSALVTKVYFPRLLLPASLAIAGLLELAVTLVFFFLLAALAYGHLPDANLIWLPLPLLVLLMVTLGTSFWLAALAARFRDVRQASGYVIQLLMFLTPVIWPLSLLTERLHLSLEPALVQLLAGLHPLVGVVEGFRRVLLGGNMPWELLGLSLLTATLLFLSGVLYFQRSERRLADGL